MFHRRLFVLFSVVALGSCSSSELTRDMAAEMIQNSEGTNYQKPITTFVVIGERCHDTPFEQPEYLKHQHHDLQALQKAGLITLQIEDVTSRMVKKTRRRIFGEEFVDESVIKGNVPPLCKDVFDAKLNSPGREVSVTLSNYMIVRAAPTAEGRRLGIKEGRQDLEVGKRTDFEVTGLTKNADLTTTALYKYKNVLTELGRASGLAANLTPETTGIATFKKFDDGWRVAVEKEKNPLYY